MKHPSHSFPAILLTIALVSGPACKPNGVPQDVPNADASDADAPDSGLSFPEYRSTQARAASAPTDVATLTSDNADFAFAINRVANTDPGNTAFSPHSISIALAMTRAGAVGATGTEIDAALRFTLAGDRLHQAFNALALDLAQAPAQATAADTMPDPARPALQLHWVNDLWVGAGQRIVPTYLDTLARYYGAGVHIAPFERPVEATRLVNLWVSIHTEGLIPDLIDTLPPDTQWVLTNAVYLNARWKFPFEARMTSEGDFTTENSGTVRARFMRRSSPVTAAYARGTSWTAAEVPYVGDRVAMLFVMPDAGTFSTFERALDGAQYRSIVAALSEQPVSLSVPKFTVRRSLELKDALIALGMRQAFGGPDFSAMFS
jgi:serpin B